MANLFVSEKLREFADLLEQQDADGFRVSAYRNAADFLTTFQEPVEKILGREGRSGLIALPTIGKAIAGAISEIVLSGRWTQLERLQGELSPEKLFQTIPGIGAVLAERLSDDCQLETLDDLESEIHFGTRKIEGLGPRRRQAIAAILAQRLGRPVFDPATGRNEFPSTKLLLEVDEMYRNRASAGDLKRIAPKRFNPTGRQWLPIMHARHDDWHFTVLFSNSKLAHQFGKTDDWVIIYFHETGQAERRCTVVTETRGPQSGKRVIRGLERRNSEEE